MTWIDNNGDERPQSWEEYCSLSETVPVWMITHEEYRPPRKEQRGSLPPMRKRLFRANPSCFWCGRRVYLHVKHASPELATVDHLYSRLHPERERHHREQRRVLQVLSCYQCNHNRSVCEQQGRAFIPELPERLEFAQLADATLAPAAKKETQPAAVIPAQEEVPVKPERDPSVVLSLKDEYAVEVLRYKRSRVCTMKEAVEFAKANPAR